MKISIPKSLLPLLPEEIKQMFQKLAASEETPIQLLENLVLYGDKYIRESIAKNSNTPTCLLESIANFKEQLLHQDFRIRRSHPSHSRFIN